MTVATDAARQMSLTATARSAAGTLRQEILVGGRHLLTTDQPSSYGGEDAGPTPHELFPAALAACVAVTLAAYARTKRWDLGQVTVDVDYDHHSKPRRFETTIRLTGYLDPEQLERLEKVAAACPLRRSIEAGIEFSERIESNQSDPRSSET
jgi:putative redox protein